MRKKVGVFAVLLIIFFANFVFASFDTGEHSIGKEYGPEESIKGWIEISFVNEATDSMFEDSEGNSISLTGLLNENPSFDYSISYAAIGTGEETKNFNLNSGDSKAIGFKFNEKCTK